MLLLATRVPCGLSIAVRTAEWLRIAPTRPSSAFGAGRFCSGSILERGCQVTVPCVFGKVRAAWVPAPTQG